MISQSFVSAVEYRRQDLLAEAARARLTNERMAEARSTPKRSSAGRVQPLVRRAFAPLATLAALV